MKVPGIQTYELHDAQGNLRVRFGNLDGDSTVEKYMYHITRDGEYVDGVIIAGRAENAVLDQLAATYEGCHVWVLLAGPSWYSIAAAGLRFSRWEEENAKSVPECVRIAEYLREK